MCGSLKMFLEVVVNWKIPETSVQFNRLFCATASKQAMKYIVMATIKFSVENSEYKFPDPFRNKPSINFKRFYCWSSHDVTKIQTTKLSIQLRFYFHGVLERLKTDFQTNFRFKTVLRFAIKYAWISKLLREAAYSWQPRKLSFRLKKRFFSKNFAI